MIRPTTVLPSDATCKAITTSSGVESRTARFYYNDNTIPISNPGNNLMTQIKDCPKNTPINSSIQIEPAQIKAILKLYEEKGLNKKIPKQLLP